MQYSNIRVQASDGATGPGSSSPSCSSACPGCLGPGIFTTWPIVTLLLLVGDTLSNDEYCICPNAWQVRLHAYTVYYIMRCFFTGSFEKHCDIWNTLCLATARKNTEKKKKITVWTSYKIFFNIVHYHQFHISTYHFIFHHHQSFYHFILSNYHYHIISSGKGS